MAITMGETTEEMVREFRQMHKSEQAILIRKMRGLIYAISSDEINSIDSRNRSEIEWCKKVASID